VIYYTMVGPQRTISLSEVYPFTRINFVFLRHLKKNLGEKG